MSGEWNLDVMRRLAGLERRLGITEVRENPVGLAYAPYPCPRCVWIAERTDGVAGNGSEASPYDGSTKAKFDGVITALGTSPVHIYLCCGTYVTDGINMYNNWQITGAGIDLTVVKYDGAVDINGVIGSCNVALADTLTDLYVSDLTVDCDGYDQDTRNTTAVFLRGLGNLTVERVKAINPSRPDSEGHIIRCTSFSQVAHSYSFAIRDCLVSDCWGPTNVPSCTGFLCSHGVVGQEPGAYFNHGSIIERCTMHGGWLGANGMNCKNFRISNCYIADAQEGLLIDTGDFYDVVMDNNHIRNVQQFGIIIGANNANYTFVNCAALNNIVHTGAAGAVGIAIAGNTNYTTLRNNIVYGSGTKAVGLFNTGNVAVVWDNNNIVNGTVDLLPLIHARTIDGTIKTGPNHERKMYSVDLTDNVATQVFTITTPNPTGNADGGGYSCVLHALIFDGANTVTNTAAKSWTAQFCRTMEATGTGVTSAVSEVVETASAATTPAQVDIGTVTLTLSETSEYVTSVLMQADHTGASGAALRCVIMVDLLWYGFVTEPVLS